MELFGIFMSFGSIVIIAIFLVIVFLVTGAVKAVPQGNEWTVERFGKFTRLLDPGLHIIVPFFDSVGIRMNVMEQVLDIPSQEVISKDNAMVTVDGVVFYQVVDTPRASYQVRNLTRAIVNLTMTNIRTVVGSMDLDEILSNRDRINESLMRVIDDASDPWGVKITRVEIKDITPPRDLVDAMARQMKAEREKRANILEAEGFRAAEILKSEGEKQSLILEAEGRREAAFRDAEAREREAEAEARATEMVSKAIAEGDLQAVNYFVANNYITALKEIASSNNGKLVFMPLEASSVIGAIGDEHSHRDLDVLNAWTQVESVTPIQKRHKLVSREAHPQNSTVNAGGVIVGGKKIQVMAGPCSVESEEQLMKTAHAVKAAGASMLRGVPLLAPHSDAENMLPSRTSTAIRPSRSSSAVAPSARRDARRSW